MKLGTTTQTRVALVVAAAVFIAHIVAAGIVWVVLHAREPPAIPVIGRGVATLLGELYDEGPAVRPSILEGAARAGLALRPLSAAESSHCKTVDRPFPPWEPRNARPRAEVALCTPALADGIQTAFRTLGGNWLGVIDSENAPPRHEPPHHPPETFLATLLLFTIAIIVMLSVWITRGVTSPLLRLADAADRIDAESGGSIEPTGGTSEIRQIAAAFNRLIERLRAYASEQRRLVAGVSHDLRTPLTRLRLRLEQVEDEGVREKLLHDVQVMQGVVDSSLSLIRARESGVRKADVDLGALLSTLVDNFTDSGLDVLFTGPQRLKISCDSALLSRAVANLVDNALKFAGNAEVRLRDAGAAAVIEVSDGGPGISDEQKARVFEAFYRSDESRGRTEGSGLGLSITKALVEAHGGTVELRDAVPHGLVARVTVPKV